MNSFNRLSYTYIILFNKKRIYDYNKKMPEILYFKKMRIFAIQTEVVSITEIAK